LIGHKCLPDGGIIVDVLSHHVQHLRETHERDKGRIESLHLCRIGQRGALQTRVRLQPVGNIQNLLGTSRCRRDLSQQSIGVKCHWGQQLVQLCGRRRRRLRQERGSKVVRE
jgi:hypothetical protein